MSDSLGFEIPHNVRNFIHDFRVAIFSFERDFSEIGSFNYDSADLIIYPEGITNVTFSCAISSMPQQGEFTLIGSLGGKPDVGKNRPVAEQRITTVSGVQVEKSKIETAGDNISKGDVLKSKIGYTTGQTEVESRPLDIGAMFTNIRHIVKPMDYVCIFTKDVRTNLWHGSKQIEHTAVPSDAKPKFVGIITDIVPNYDAGRNNITYSIRFKTMLRLLELARYALELSVIPILKNLNDKEVGENVPEELLQHSSISSDEPPHVILKKTLKDDYPSQLLGPRIEEDETRCEAKSANFEIFFPQSILARTNYESKLNKIRQWAANKDFEFYAAEDGQLVWKLPTYARGINKKEGNFVTDNEFNPDDYTKDDETHLYHIHDFMSLVYHETETEYINVMSGDSDWTFNGLAGENFNTLQDTRLTYFIEGGRNVPPEREIERRFGYRDIGVRPLSVRNPIGYNLGDESNIFGVTVNKNVMFDQIYYYDFKAWKLNLSKGITGTLTMIDDPRIQCGMPIVVPMFANVGFGKAKGRLVPSIFYIVGTNRRYEYQKPPILTLSLTHGRMLTEEFHNGIHLYDRLSSWVARLEPKLVDTSNSSNPKLKELIKFGENDKRINELMDRYDELKTHAEAIDKLRQIKEAREQANANTTIGIEINEDDLNTN